MLYFCYLLVDDNNIRRNPSVLPSSLHENGYEESASTRPIPPCYGVVYKLVDPVVVP